MSVSPHWTSIMGPVAAEPRDSIGVIAFPRAGDGGPGAAGGRIRRGIPLGWRRIVPPLTTVELTCSVPRTVGTKEGTHERSWSERHGYGHGHGHGHGYGHEPWLGARPHGPELGSLCDAPGHQCVSGGTG